MEEFSPYFKHIDSFCDKLVDAIERQYSGLTFSGYVIEDWAREHEAVLSSRHNALRDELCAMKEANRGDDIEQFRKKLLDWGKTVLKIHEKYHAWGRVQHSGVDLAAPHEERTVVAVAPLPPAAAPQLQQARLI